MPQQNLLRAILVGLAWTVAQCVVYLIVFELGRGRLWIDVLSIPDPMRAFFWQNYTFLFAGLSLAANVWIERHGLTRTFSRRFGVWLALLLVLLFFSRVHFRPRPEAVAVTFLSTAIAVLFRESAAMFLRNRSRSRARANDQQP